MKNIKKKVNLAEDAPLLGIQAQIQHFDLENVVSALMIHMEPDFFHFQIFKNTNFEELQNLFDTIQKLTSLSSGQRQKHEFIQIPSFAWERLSELARSKMVRPSGRI